jgi:hypothetical protein
VFDDAHLGDGKTSVAIALTMPSKDKSLIQAATEGMAKGVFRT